MLKNECRISAAWIPTSGAPQPKLVSFQAIWDTGATGSVTSQNVVDACGLAPTGIAEVHGIHGSNQVETFLINIGLPGDVIFMAINATKGTMPGADVLIGMDIIASGDFSVTNSQGFTKFSYRTPSIEHVDYVEQANRAKSNIHPEGGTRSERRRKKFGRD